MLDDFHFLAEVALFGSALTLRNCTVPFFNVRDFLANFRLFALIVSFFTFTVIFFVSFPAFTVITACPAFFAVIFPEELTVATDFLLDL